jgi:hypothetical protein
MGAVGFSLGIQSERDGSSTVEGIVQDEIQGRDVGHFVPFNLSAADPLEIIFYDRRSNPITQYRIYLRVTGDQSDVDPVALITTSGVSDGT